MRTYIPHVTLDSCKTSVSLSLIARAYRSDQIKYVAIFPLVENPCSRQRMLCYPSPLPNGGRSKERRPKYQPGQCWYYLGTFYCRVGKMGKTGSPKWRMKLLGSLMAISRPCTPSCTRHGVVIASRSRDRRPRSAPTAWHNDSEKCGPKRPFFMTAWHVHA